MHNYTLCTYHNRPTTKMNSILLTGTICTWCLSHLDLSNRGLMLRFDSESALSTGIHDMWQSSWLWYKKKTCMHSGHNVIQIIIHLIIFAGCWNGTSYSKLRFIYRTDQYFASHCLRMGTNSIFYQVVLISQKITYSPRNAMLQ